MQPPDIGLVSLPPGGKNRRFAALFRQLSLQLGDSAADGFGLHIHTPKILGKLFCSGVELFQSGLFLLQNKLGRCVIRLRLFCGLGELFQLGQPDGDFQPTEFIPENQIFFCLLRLLPQGRHLKLQLRDLVIDPQQIVLGLLKLPLGLFLPVTVLGNTRRLFKDLPSVRGLGGKDLVNAALTNIAVALFAQARIHKQLIDIPEPSRLAIDIIFTVAGAIVAPGDHHLGRFQPEDVRRIVQYQRHLRKAYLWPFQGAAKDDVLHLAAPERLGAHFSHDPANGIGNIGFAAAVGAYNGGDIAAKGHDGLIRKGFEVRRIFNCL